MSAYSDARNARAKALGFDSYSQQYRAKKAGYGTAAAYKAAVATKASGRLNASKVAAKLIGARATAAGTVVAATWRGSQMSAQWDMIRRRVDSRHVVLVVEMRDGTIARPGGRWGYAVGYLRGLVADEGSWKGAILALLGLLYDEFEEPKIVTATIR